MNKPGERLKILGEKKMQCLLKEDAVSAQPSPLPHLDVKMLLVLGTELQPGLHTLVGDPPQTLLFNFSPWKKIAPAGLCLDSLPSPKLPCRDRLQGQLEQSHKPQRIISQFM